MKLHLQLVFGLVFTVLALGVATAADNHDAKPRGSSHGMNCDGMDMMQGKGHMMADPTAGVHQHLKELKAKLKLAKDQEPAWQAFSEQVTSQAQSMASMRSKMKGNMQGKPATAPERMTMMAEMMDKRAQIMTAMASAVKTFYASLTPEQKSEFDNIHMSHMKSMHETK